MLFLALLVWVAARTDELLVEETVSVDRVVDGKVDVRFRFQNKSFQTVRIIGATQTCGPNGCNEVHGLPAAIPPFSEYDLRVTLHVEPPSDVQKQFRVFTSFPGREEIDLTIEASATPRTAKPAAQ